MPVEPLRYLSHNARITKYEYIQTLLIMVQ